MIRFFVRKTVVDFFRDELESANTAGHVELFFFPEDRVVGPMSFGEHELVEVEWKAKDIFK